MLHAFFARRSAPAACRGASWSARGPCLWAPPSGLDFRPLLAAPLVRGLADPLNGAMHEDGLADCADGFFGGATRERKLEIMRDSRIGTFGALALLLSFSFAGREPCPHRQRKPQILRAPC